MRKGLGYVNLHISEYDDADYRFLRRYGFYISFGLTSRSWSNNGYPPFCTYLAGRLVLVYVDGLENTVRLAYSAKAKKQMRKRIDRFLGKPQRMVFRDMNGKIAFIDKRGRTQPAGRFDSGKVIYVRRDSSVIVRMANDFSPVK